MGGSAVCRPTGGRLCLLRMLHRGVAGPAVEWAHINGQPEVMAHARVMDGLYLGHARRECEMGNRHVAAADCQNCLLGPLAGDKVVVRY